MIATFTHGDNGLRIKANPFNQDERSYGRNIKGPMLLFSPASFLTARHVAELQGDRPPADPLFSARPIVFLNGCSTGAVAGFEEGGVSPFQMAFLREGARAVIVTEAPVLDTFGEKFGEQFLTHLFNGENVTVALRDARQDEWDNNKNPLGLLYALYGNDLARIEPPLEADQ